MQGWLRLDHIHTARRLGGLLTLSSKELCHKELVFPTCPGSASRQSRNRLKKCRRRLFDAWLKGVGKESPKEYLAETEEH